MKLGDLITLQGGGTPSKDVEKYWNGSIPWATVKDLKGMALDDTIDHISEEGLKNSASRIIPAGNIIIATRMAVGKVAENLRDVAINQDLKGIIANPEKLDKRYLLHFLTSKESYFQSQGSGATVKGIKIQHILELTIPLPPLSEQRRIAEVLDGADALRRLDRELVGRYDALIQSVFYDMFGDPVKNEKGWEVRKLGEVGKVVTGSTPPSSGTEMFGVDIPFITPGDLGSGFTAKRFLSVKGAGYSRTVKAGSLLVCCIGATIGKMAKAQVYSAFNQQINAVEWGKDVNSDYGFVVFQSFKNEVVRRGISTTLPILKKSEFQKIEIPVPPLSLQQRFAEVVQGIESQKAVAEAGLRRSEELMGSLMAEVWG